MWLSYDFVRMEKGDAIMNDNMFHLELSENK